MTRVVSLGLARAIQRHAAASRQAECAEAAEDDAAIERLCGVEAETLDGVVAALPTVASPDDAAAVVEHAREMGGRDAAVELILLRGLAAALARRAFAEAA